MDSLGEAYREVGSEGGRAAGGGWDRIGGASVVGTGWSAGGRIALSWAISCLSFAISRAGSLGEISKSELI